MCARSADLVYSWYYYLIIVCHWYYIIINAHSSDYSRYSVAGLIILQIGNM